MKCYKILQIVFWSYEVLYDSVKYDMRSYEKFVPNPRKMAACSYKKWPDEKCYVILWKCNKILRLFMWSYEHC